MGSVFLEKIQKEAMEVCDALRVTEQLAALKEQEALEKEKQLEDLYLTKEFIAEAQRQHKSVIDPAILSRLAKLEAVGGVEVFVDEGRLTEGIARARLDLHDAEERLKMAELQVLLKEKQLKDFEDNYGPVVEAKSILDGAMNEKCDVMEVLNSVLRLYFK